MVRVLYEEMKNTFESVLLGRGMQKGDAELCARLIADTSLEGVYTHGANRFPSLIRNIDKKVVDINAQMQLRGRYGALERWDGRKGVGNLNAYRATERCIALAKEHTIGCVALSNTNHWMRPGTYGLMAADADCIGMLWTNTTALMPPWQGVDAKVGNNPLVLAIPAKEGPVLVDMAMSLFSYGKLETYARENRPLPVVGGYDEDGQLTDDAEKIMQSKRPLPIGFWKGTSLALALDLIAASLSGGRTTRSVGTLEGESEVSQVFFAFNLSGFEDRDRIEAEIQASLDDLRQSETVDGSAAIRFPGENRQKIRSENLMHGIPVDTTIWQTILAL